ncbi:MAG: nuclear transport factor 2 family protein [Verrucomicrobiales bacterium]|nr:nuclear transport factor 2 family protein [Verrucomicrobiales bacterium]
MRSTAAGPDAAAVVQRQLDAYNARDVDALLEVYALDAQLFEHPAKLLADGSAELRARFTERFREPDLHAQLLSRVVMGNIVVDHECVTRNFPEGHGTLAMIMIYDVSGDRIQRAWSIAGARDIDSAR